MKNKVILQVLLQMKPNKIISRMKTHLKKESSFKSKPIKSKKDGKSMWCLCYSVGGKREPLTRSSKADLLHNPPCLVGERLRSVIVGYFHCSAASLPKVATKERWSQYAKVSWHGGTHWSHPAKPVWCVHTLMWSWGSSVQFVWMSHGDTQGLPPCKTGYGNWMQNVICNAIILCFWKTDVLSAQILLADAEIDQEKHLWDTL